MKHTNVLGKQKYNISLYDLIEEEKKREIIATEKLKNNGYDGVYVFFKKFYVIFNPNQIKSIDNDGSWDINDNNMYS